MANSDLTLGDLKLAVFEAPEEFKTEMGLFLAASTSGPGWRRRYVEVSHAGRTHVVQTPPRKSVLGHAEGALGREASVEIALHDREQWLVSCSDEDLEQGGNLAVLGREFIQFGEATSLGSGRFRLGRLWRGRWGTEHEIGSHSKNEPFALIEPGTLQPIRLKPGLSERSTP